MLNLALRFKSLTYKGVHLKKHNFFASRVSIGSGTRINGGFKCKGGGKASIGKYCAFGENIRFITSNHNLDTLNLQVHLNKQLSIPSGDEKKRDIQIGNNVWIGDNVIILPGVKVGDCAIIGAGALVVKNVEPFSIYGGNPAKFIKFRYSSKEVLDLLKGVTWWDWPLSRILANSHFFSLNFNEISIEKLKEEISNLK